MILKKSAAMITTHLNDVVQSGNDFSKKIHKKKHYLNEMNKLSRTFDFSINWPNLFDWVPNPFEQTFFYVRMESIGSQWILEIESRGLEKTNTETNKKSINLLKVLMNFNATLIRLCTRLQIQKYAQENTRTRLEKKIAYFLSI